LRVTISIHSVGTKLQFKKKKKKWQRGSPNSSSSISEKSMSSFLVYAVCLWAQRCSIQKYF